MLIAELRKTWSRPLITAAFVLVCLAQVFYGLANFDADDRTVGEQKARVTYDNILRISDDPDVNDVIRFLREREVVHFQRFGEAIEKLREKLNQKNVYCMNPAIDI